MRQYEYMEQQTAGYTGPSPSEPPINQSEPIVQPPTKPKPQSSLIPILVGLLLLTLGGVGGLMLGRNPTLLHPPTSSPTPIPTKITEVTPTPDTTTGWKTYLNKDRPTFTNDNWTNYRPISGKITPFEFKYPDTWTGVDYRRYGFGLLDTGKGGIFDLMVISLTKNQHCFDTFVPEKIEGIIKVYSKEDIVVGTMSGKKIVMTTAVDYPGGVPWLVHKYCLQEGDNAVIIGFNSPSDKGLTVNNELQYQILSTFRFTKNSQAVTSPSSYEACIKSPGSRILETFPEQCVTADGKRFTKP